MNKLRAHQNELIFRISGLGRVVGFRSRWRVGYFRGWRRENGLSFVTNVGPVTVLISPVGDDLSAAIGQEDAVLAGHHFAIAFLLVAEIVAARFI